MSIRRGISLVEMLVVMSGATMILSLSAQLMHRAMRTQAETRYFFEVERTAQRLAEDFRMDVHAARRATASGDQIGDDDLLRLELADDRTVEYRRQAEKVVRTASEDGGVVSREEYVLSAAMAVQIRVAESPPRATLEIQCEPLSAAAEPPPSTSLRQAPINLQVTAIVGRDHRYGESSDTEEESP